ncbi:unnamed protein product [Closterium sp. Naga37s-1]|nr:unnamed protein product [Closterium sp. Naga37s-1]
MQKEEQHLPVRRFDPLGGKGSTREEQQEEEQHLPDQHKEEQQEEEQHLPVRRFDPLGGKGSTQEEQQEEEQHLPDQHKEEQQEVERRLQVRRFDPLGGKGSTQEEQQEVERRLQPRDFKTGAEEAQRRGGAEERRRGGEEARRRGDAEAWRRGAAEAKENSLPLNCRRCIFGDGAADEEEQGRCIKGGGPEESRAALAPTAAGLMEGGRRQGDDWQLLGAEEKARCYLPRSYLPPMSCIRGGADEMHQRRRSRGDASEEEEQRRCIRGGGGAEDKHHQRRSIVSEEEGQRRCIRRRSIGDASEEVEQRRGDASEEVEQRRCIRGGGAAEEWRLAKDRRSKGTEEAKENPLPLLVRISVPALDTWPLHHSLRICSPSNLGTGSRRVGAAEETAKQRRGRRGKGDDGEEEGDGALKRHGAEGTEEKAGGRKAKGAEEQRTAQLRFPPRLLAARRVEAAVSALHSSALISSPPIPQKDTEAREQQTRRISSGDAEQTAATGEQSRRVDCHERASELYLPLPTFCRGAVQGMMQLCRG